MTRRRGIPGLARSSEFRDGLLSRLLGSGELERSQSVWIEYDCAYRTLLYYTPDGRRMTHVQAICNPSIEYSIEYMESIIQM